MLTHPQARARAARNLFPWLCVLVFCAGTFAAPSLPVAAPAAARPNVVVIMTDDQTVESLRVMRKTRALIGRRGTTFNNSFVSFPLCCPSRATFLTGQYPHNHGVLSNNAPRGGYDALNHGNTLPIWLREAGYHTAHVGKYLNEYGEGDPTEVPPGWDNWQGVTHGFKNYGYKLNDNGKVIQYGDKAADYQTDVLARRAQRAISTAAAKQPFFLSVATLAPHSETNAGFEGFPNPRPAPRHQGAFANERLPKPPAFNEANVSDKPSFIRKLTPIPASGIESITERYRSRLASLLAVDDLVERIVERLSAAGVLENTMLIFTADNGFFHGEHRIRKSKFEVYEEAVRVPLLIRGGGFPAGATSDKFVSNIDLAPTIVDLAGAAARRDMDGRSLLQLVRRPGLETERDLLIEGSSYKAVRNPSFLYVEYNQGERELYDMRRASENYDPYQLQSRHADSAYNPIKTRLANKLDQLRRCSGLSCRTR